MDCAHGIFMTKSETDFYHSNAVRDLRTYSKPEVKDIKRNLPVPYRNPESFKTYRFTSIITGQWSEPSTSERISELITKGCTRSFTKK